MSSIFEDAKAGLLPEADLMLDDIVVAKMDRFGRVHPVLQSPSALALMRYQTQPKKPDPVEDAP